MFDYISNPGLNIANCDRMDTKGNILLLCAYLYIIYVEQRGFCIIIWSVLYLLQQRHKYLFQGNNKGNIIFIVQIVGKAASTSMHTLICRPKEMGGGDSWWRLEVNLVSELLLDKCNQYTLDKMSDQNHPAKMLLQLFIFILKCLQLNEIHFTNHFTKMICSTSDRNISRIYLRPPSVLNKTAWSPVLARNTFRCLLDALFAKCSPCLICYQCKSISS